METTTQKTVEAIKELIIINNDRYEGYKKATEEVKDSDLKKLFTEFSMQSEKFSKELIALLPDKTEAPVNGETKLSGKLYRVWMDIKNGIAGNDRKSVLSSCEYGEDVAKKTYDDVLKDSGDISNEALEVMRKQKTEILQAHNKIKLLRDQA